MQRVAPHVSVPVGAVADADDTDARPKRMLVFSVQPLLQLIMPTHGPLVPQPPRGHGTQILDEKLVATQCGLVTRTDKLISVKPPKER